jgi:hypothetical protein
MVVDAAPLAQEARERDPQAADQAAEQQHPRERDRGGQPFGQHPGAGRRPQAAEQQRAFVADHDHAEPRGQRRAERRQHQRRRAGQRVFDREARAERATVHVRVDGERLGLDHQQDDREQQHRDQEGRGCETEQGRTVGEPCSVEVHDSLPVEPTTPSMR